MRSDEDLQRRMQSYRKLHAVGIYPDPKTMGYRDEKDRRRDIEALAAVLREESGQETGSNAVKRSE